MDTEKLSWLQFCREAIAFRKAHPTFYRRHFLNSVPAESEAEQGIWWHPDGRRIESHEWQEAGLKAFGLILLGDRMGDVAQDGSPLRDDTFLVAFNPSEDVKEMVLPTWGGTWTTCPPFSEESISPEGARIDVAAQSVTVLRADSHP